MRNPNVDPSGKKYNFEDPLGVVAREKSIEEKLRSPNVIQLFLEAESIKKDRARQFRLIKVSQHILYQEFFDCISKLIGMVVTIEKNGYIHGRIVDIKAGLLVMQIRGTKETKYIGFDEVVRLRENYA